MKVGHWIVEEDEFRRIRQFSRSKTGIHRTCKVHYVLDNGTENVCKGSEEITFAIRTRVK